METAFGQDLNGDGITGIYAAPGTTLVINQLLSGTAGVATIGAGATLQLTGGDTSSVTFTASTGELILDQPSQFSGQIDGFTGNGTLSGSDQIDLENINYSSVSESYSNGVLTVTDGTDTANLDFNGSYVLANFSLASDGNGGTIVYDPPVTPSNGLSGSQPQTPTKLGGIGNLAAAFGPQPTLGYLPDGNSNSTVSPTSGPNNANIALLSHYMASSFPSLSATPAGAILGEGAGQFASQPQLTNLHHA